VLTGVFDKFKNTATARAGIEGMSLKVVNFLYCKRPSFVLGMSRPSTNFARLFAFPISRRLDNIRRWRFGIVRGILREFSDLVIEFGHLFHNLSDLLFKLRNALNVEFFFFRSQFSSSSHLLWLLSGERGPPFEKRYFQLVLQS